MPFKILVTILLCNAVFAVIAVPLILRKVPRNIVYGFRTRSTLEDDFVWYEANAYFGKLFLISSFVSAFLMTAFYFADVLPALYLINGSIAVLVLPSGVAVLMTFRYIKSIKRSKDKSCRK